MDLATLTILSEERIKSLKNYRLLFYGIMLFEMGYLTGRNIADNPPPVEYALFAFWIYAAVRITYQIEDIERQFVEASRYSTPGGDKRLYQHYLDRLEEEVKETMRKILFFF